MCARFKQVLAEIDFWLAALVRPQISEVLPFESKKWDFEPSRCSANLDQIEPKIDMRGIYRIISPVVTEFAHKSHL